MKIKWTDEEVKVLKNKKLGSLEVAKQLGRSYDAVNSKRRSLGIRVDLDRPAPKHEDTTVHQDKEKVSEAYWQNQHDILARKYDTLLKESVVVDRLVQDIKAVAPLSYQPAPKIVQSDRSSKSQPQSALLMLSDTHIGAVVSESQTVQFGHYNFGIFMARLKYLEESVLSIVKNHITTQVPELVVTVLGDMLDGALNHAAECGQVNTIFDQFYAGGHALAQFLRNLSRAFPRVRVYCVVGNHTRFQNQHKMPTKNKYSNFDQFLYAFVAALTRDIANIEWNLNDQMFQEFKVQRSHFYAFHGENLRGGDKMLGIPNHAVGRIVSTTTQLYNKHERPAPNYYLVGHLHRPISLPHAVGDVIINGGFVGVDTFSLNSAFTPSDPQQKLFFVHPVYGKTASYDISLKFAEESETPPYTVPPGFAIK